MRRFILLTLFLVLTSLSGGCTLFQPSHHRIQDYTPVFANASAGNLPAVREAVKEDRTVLTAREWDDATLLHLAVGQNHRDMVQFLLNEGADVNAITKDRLTPLHMAAQNGNLEIVQFLLARHANINAVDAKGWTPVDRAMKWRHPDVASFLKDHARSLDSADVSGWEGFYLLTLETPQLKRATASPVATRFIVVRDRWWLPRR